MRIQARYIYFALDFYIHNNTTTDLTGRSGLWPVGWETLFQGITSVSWHFIYGLAFITLFSPLAL